MSAKMEKHLLEIEIKVEYKKMEKEIQLTMAASGGDVVSWGEKGRTCTGCCLGFLLGNEWKVGLGDFYRAKGA